VTIFFREGDEIFMVKIDSTNQDEFSFNVVTEDVPGAVMQKKERVYPKVKQVVKEELLFDIYQGVRDTHFSLGVLSLYLSNTVKKAKGTNDRVSSQNEAAVAADDAKALTTYEKAALSNIESLNKLFYDLTNAANLMTLENVMTKVGLCPSLMEYMVDYLDGEIKALKAQIKADSASGKISNDTNLKADVVCAYKLIKKIVKNLFELTKDIKEEDGEGFAQKVFKNLNLDDED